MPRVQRDSDGCDGQPVPKKPTASIPESIEGSPEGSAETFLKPISCLVKIVAKNTTMKGRSAKAGRQSQLALIMHSLTSRITFLPLLLVLLLSGCIAAPAVQLLAKQASELAQQRRSANLSTTPEVESTAATLDLAEASRNRLLVLGVDGNLFTVEPDGSGRFALTTDAGPRRTYTQPTWSATGKRIAWTAIARVDGVRGALITASANGMARTENATVFPPFYLYWSPDDSKVAYLSNWLAPSGQTIALHVANILAPDSVDTNTAPLVETDPIGVGQPFYFSWAPSADQLIAHVGNREVILLDLAAEEPSILVEESANFAAPMGYGGNCDSWHFSRRFNRQQGRIALCDQG